MGMLKLTLRAARVNAGLIQNVAAEALGIRPETLRSWEHGETFPNADMIPKICELYGVTYDQLTFKPN